MGHPDVPELPPPPPAKEDPTIQATAAAERARLKGRKGRASTILTRGVLTGPEPEGSTSLLGGTK